MSKTQILCHIVFGTRLRRMTLVKEHRHELYKYIFGILDHLNCSLVRINGIEDHVHILMELHPTQALSEVVKKVKQSSSHWIRETHVFADFDGWGSGYFAVSVSPADKESCRQYIINQAEHHRGEAYAEELREMLARHGMQWYEDEWG